MPQEVDLSGLPESVANGLMETIHNLKSRYGANNFPSQKMTPEEAERASEEALDTLECRNQTDRKKWTWTSA